MDPILELIKHFWPFIAIIIGVNVLRSLIIRRAARRRAKREEELAEYQAQQIAKELHKLEHPEEYENEETAQH